MKKHCKLLIAVLAYVCAGSVGLTAPAFAQSNSATAQPHDDDIMLHHSPPVPRGALQYHPITVDGRLSWFLYSTTGPKSLIGGLFSSAIGTAYNNPHEYGPHWDGFAKRYGMRLTGVSTGNAIQATVGSLWREDPRYFHAAGQPFGARVKNIVDLTFRAYQADGERHPAYARFLGTFGNNFLSNTWRAQSDADWQHALIRSGEGLASRALSNAVSEFFPEAWQKLRGQHSNPGP